MYLTLGLVLDSLIVTQQEIYFVTVQNAWGGAVKYKTVQIRDYNFSKHLLNEDFFHVKMTPENKDLACFSLKILPLKDLCKVYPKIWQDYWKNALFLESDCFDTLNTITWFPVLSKNKTKQNKTTKKQKPKNNTNKQTTTTTKP